MKGHVQQRGKTYAFSDGDPDPLTGKRRQVAKGGFATEREALAACREAMVDREQGRLVRQSRRTVEQLVEEWLSRRQHSVKQSMHANSRCALSSMTPPLPRCATQRLISWN